MGSIPVKRWIINSQKEDLSGLQYTDATLDTSLGPDDVLVEMRAGSINYRDLLIGRVTALFPFTPAIVLSLMPAIMRVIC